MASVDVVFKKNLIGVYGNHIFFEMDWCDGKNQLLQFWNERFMPEAFEYQEGLSYGNVGIL